MQGFAPPMEPVYQPNQKPKQEGKKKKGPALTTEPMYLPKAISALSYSSQLVSMNPPDQPLPKVLPGKNFIKTWTVMNNGLLLWPVGTQFSYVTGTYMQTLAVRLTQEVKPGE